MEDSYKIIRFYRGDRPGFVIESGLTLEEAKEHCQNLESSSRTCKLPKNIQHTEKYGDWFDGYTKE
jgi:hypothetical protein